MPELTRSEAEILGARESLARAFARLEKLVALIPEKLKAYESAASEARARSAELQELLDRERVINAQRDSLSESTKEEIKGLLLKVEQLEAEAGHGDDRVEREIGDVDDDLIGDESRGRDDFDVVEREVDEATGRQHCLRLAFETHRNGHRDVVFQVDLNEVDVLHRALHRMALHVFHDGRVHLAVDGEVEPGVGARWARQGKAQVASGGRNL